jgi:hypothetical protein
MPWQPVGLWRRSFLNETPSRRSDIRVATRFVNLDRHTPMLLACDLREWVPQGRIVQFILDAVDQIPTGHFRVNRRVNRTGRDPSGQKPGPSAAEIGSPPIFAG